MCQALAKPLRIINFESYIGYVGFGSHNLTHVLFDLRALYTLLDSCQLDAGAKVPLESPIALFITGILGPQGEGKGFLFKQCSSEQCRVSLQSAAGSWDRGERKGFPLSSGPHWEAALQISIQT